MRRFLLAVAVSACLLRAHAQDAKSPLEGEWVAQSMEANGKAAPDEVVRRMRFTFKGDKVLVKGNFDDDRVEECPFKLDPARSPKHIEFTPPKEQKPVLGIYELKGDELRICLRHGSSDAGRPTEFATKADSKLVLIVFKKRKD